MATGSYWAGAMGPNGQVAEWVWRCEEGDAMATETTEQAASDALDAHLESHGEE